MSKKKFDLFTSVINQAYIFCSLTIEMINFVGKSQNIEKRFYSICFFIWNFEIQICRIRLIPSFIFTWATQRVLDMVENLPFQITSDQPSFWWCSKMLFCILLFILSFFVFIVLVLSFCFQFMCLIITLVSLASLTNTMTYNSLTFIIKKLKS